MEEIRFASDSHGLLLKIFTSFDNFYLSIMKNRGFVADISPS